jgi:ComF family protein
MERFWGERFHVLRNTNILKKISEEIINIVYPPTCPICGKILKLSNNQVCEDCKKKIKYMKEPTCKKCGKQLIAEEQEYCYDCSRKEHLFTRGITLWLYDTHVKKSIYNFKYNNKREYAKTYANEIIKQHHRQILNWDADGIVPIPLHKSKMKSRGFNQAEVLALALSKQLGIPMYHNLVKRIKKTLPQKALNDKQRINNLKNAFKIRKFDVKLKKVILIDDIYTTGITINSVTEVLKNAGVTEIYFITVSIGEGL